MQFFFYFEIKKQNLQLLKMKREMVHKHKLKLNPIGYGLYFVRFGMAMSSN